MRCYWRGTSTGNALGARYAFVDVTPHARLSPCAAVDFGIRVAGGVAAEKMRRAGKAEEEVEVKGKRDRESKGIRGGDWRAGG